MNTCWRLFGFFLALTFSAQPAQAVIDRFIDKTFEVKSGVVVNADTFSGGIAVTASDDARVHVRVRQTVEATDEKAAEALLAKLDVTLEQAKDGGIVLKIAPRHLVRWTWQNWSPAALVIELGVPRSCRLDLSTGEGGITVGALTGKIRARTAAGAIFIGEIDGDLTATSTRGDVSVTACTGALQLAAENGSVLVGRSGVRAVLSAVDGVIEVQAARGRVVARGNRSDIKIGFAHPVTAASLLDADGGDVTVTLDPGSAVNVHARSSKFGSVRVRDLDLKPTTGKAGESLLVGSLNGGGPLIQLRASGGQVRLNGVPSL